MMAGVRAGGRLSARAKNRAGCACRRETSPRLRRRAISSPLSVAEALECAYYQGYLLVKQTGKLRLWSGVAWIIVAGIIITLMLKGREPGDELRVLITVFAFLASAWYSVVQYRKEKHFRS